MQIGGDGIGIEEVLEGLAGGIPGEAPATVSDSRTRRRWPAPRAPRAGSGPPAAARRRVPGNNASGCPPGRSRRRISGVSAPRLMWTITGARRPDAASTARPSAASPFWPDIADPIRTFTPTSTPG